MQRSVKETGSSATESPPFRANGKDRANNPHHVEVEIRKFEHMKAAVAKRFESTTVQINGETLHTIIDTESGQYCAVTYKHSIDAELEADFLNCADAIIDAHTRRDQSPEDIENTASE
jgi:hypothetical protein